MISEFSGNRFTSFFEKIMSPSTMTSKIPSLPFISSASILNLSEIAAFRLEASGL